MNFRACERPDTVRKLEFVNKFNVVVSFQNLETYLQFSYFFLN